MYSTSNIDQLAVRFEVNILKQTCLYMIDFFSDQRLFGAFGMHIWITIWFDIV